MVTYNYANCNSKQDNVHLQLHTFNSWILNINWYYHQFKTSLRWTLSESVRISFMLLILNGATCLQLQGKDWNTLAHILLYFPIFGKLISNIFSGSDKHYMTLIYWDASCSVLTHVGTFHMNDTIYGSEFRLQIINTVSMENESTWLWLINSLFEQQILEFYNAWIGNVRLIIGWTIGQTKINVDKHVDKHVNKVKWGE